MTMRGAGQGGGAALRLRFFTLPRRVRGFGRGNP